MGESDALSPHLEGRSNIGSQKVSCIASDQLLKDTEHLPQGDLTKLVTWPAQVIDGIAGLVIGKQLNPGSTKLVGYRPLILVEEVTHTHIRTGMHDPFSNDPLASAQVLKLEHRPTSPLTHRMDRALLFQVGSMEWVATKLRARPKDRNIHAPQLHNKTQ
eukprot:15476823-Alexandrium_andersonii.AAC.1